MKLIKAIFLVIVFLTFATPLFAQNNQWSDENKLSSEELNLIKELKDSGTLPNEFKTDNLTPSQIREIKNFLFEMAGFRRTNEFKVISESELMELEILLKKKWENMVASLKSNNVEEALKYIVTRRKESYRKVFQSNPLEIVKRLENTHVESIIDSTPETIKYSIYTEVIIEGTKRTFGSELIFVRDLDSEWRIEFF